MTVQLLEQILPTGQTIRVITGDLTKETVDAIVNAANENLMHGGGVAGAIVRRGGPDVQLESFAWIRKYGRVATGTAAITGPGNLPAKRIIHAVGPVWGSGDEEEKLAEAVTSALTLANDRNLTSISIPGISSGIFGGPKDLCARVITKAVFDFLDQTPTTTLKEIRFCNIDEPTSKEFVAAVQQMLA